MPKPNASLVLSSRDATGGRPQNGNLYNNLLFNAQNQNIIQGQVHSVAVSEVNFPYDIPNMQNGFNTFAVLGDDFPPGTFITVEQGFYTGTELAAAINAEFAAYAAGAGLIVADMPIFAFDTATNRFAIAAPVTANRAVLFNSAFTFPGNPPATVYPLPTNKLGKDIFSIMGFLSSQGDPAPNDALIVSSYPPGQGPPLVTSAQSAPLTFTQYIDICSPQLCKFQYFRDGSTTNLARRSDVICRLYIANNVATQEEEGTRPFVINRQYTNERVMRWTADNAVGTIDINLYDDVGQPLTTVWAPRPYQITFNCYEDEKKEAGGGAGDGSIMEKFANYLARNEASWASPTYPISSRR